MTCARHKPESRGERRRLQREVEATRPAPGVGQGWTLNNRRRRYRVREAPAVPLSQLIAASDAAALRLGCTCETKESAA